jgi:hypothetical protein
LWEAVRSHPPIFGDAGPLADVEIPTSSSPSPARIESRWNEVHAAESLDPDRGHPMVSNSNEIVPEMSLFVSPFLLDAHQAKLIKSM